MRCMMGELWWIMGGCFLMIRFVFAQRFTEETLSFTEIIGSGFFMNLKN